MPMSQWMILNRGLVDYFADQYDVALAAFDRYIAANPVNDGTAHYFRALTLRDSAAQPGSHRRVRLFIETILPTHNWVDAWEDKAFLQWAAAG